MLGRLDAEPLEGRGGGPLRREELGTLGFPDACPCPAYSLDRVFTGDSTARFAAHS